MNQPTSAMTETSQDAPALCATKGHWIYAIRDASRIADDILRSPTATPTERQLASCIAALVRAAHQIPCAI